MNGNPFESTMTHKFYFLVIYLGTPAIVISALKLTKTWSYSEIILYSVCVQEETLHLTGVRSQLTYCSPNWRPQIIEDIAL